MSSTKSIFGFFILLLFFACSKNKEEPQYITENVIIVVVDGARYSETWGDITHRNIPEMGNHLAAQGCVFTNFCNNGPTYTLAGHAAISTGFYQEIENSGKEYPSNPSIFQYWEYKFHSDSTKSYIIASKGKIAALANCSADNWRNKATPSTDCGIDGLGVTSGYREDSISFQKCLQILHDSHPKLVLLNFREPDYSGHQNNWNNYIKGIYDTDKYIYQLWQFLQNDSIYKAKTTLFVTNDHGRHLDSVADGFISHGDGCKGCRHIFLFAAGPDFKKGIIISKNRELIDIPVTIGVLMGFKLPYTHGKVMYELFNN